MKRLSIWTAMPAAAVVLLGSLVRAQGTTDPVAQYRAMLGDDNPAELWETRGQALWNEPRGPKHVPLNQCDLGLGVGVLAGAYAKLPRYFADTGKVQDLESRLMTCMTQQQGFAVSEISANRFGEGDSKRSDMEALTAYVVAQSQGAKMSVPFDRAEERLAYARGEQIFFYRAGTHDFSCATCHSQDDKRVRLQSVPNLTTAKGAQAAYTTWPAYRVSQGEVRTMEWRLNDCFRQQRLPDLNYGSDAAIALTMYLARNAEGGAMNAPAIKR